jgi:S-methylmethionine-dependent homocysteine/selenocysteine methylase
VGAFEQLRASRDAGAILVLDGAMGTELQARGVRMDSHAWCGLANLNEPQLVRAIHEDHIRAGAEVVITNTYMSGSGPMHRAGAGDRFAEGITNAVQAAQQAVQDAAERPVAIAGSVGATRWGQPEGDGRRALRDGYAREMELLAESGVDLIALEMVTEPRLAEAALEAALESGLPVWLGLSMRAVGRDQTGYDSLPDLTEAQTVVQACLTSSLDAVNVMHTEIDDVAPAITMLRPLWDGPLGVYPHHGRWSPPEWGFVDVDPDQLAELADTWIELGATMVGGCCGLGTRHVEALRAAVDARPSA